MTKHVMSITYKPKIEPVLIGACRQTIRKGRRFKEGDEILMHGWEGRPYRSKWSWRKRVVVTHAIPITISKDGIYYQDNVDIWRWFDVIVDCMAENDFIDPPTGEELRNVLFGLNEIPDDPQEYQIIRW